MRKKLKREKEVKGISHEEKVFAQGLCKEKLFLVFVIGSIFGAYYEQILNLIKVFFRKGIIVWELRRGVIYGPFSPIYGVGAVLIVWLLARKKRSPLHTILYGAMVGGIFEYLISFLQETFVGTVSWDYSQQFLNINGRTTIPFMLVWGLFAFVFIQYIYPKISDMIESIPYRFGKIMVSVLAVFLVFDMLISWTALFRQTQRRNNIEPVTRVGEFYDKVYTDERLKKCFPNMKAKDR